MKERIESLEALLEMQITINEDTTVLLAMQREMIERMQEQLDTQADSIRECHFALEGLLLDHRQYGDHMNQGNEYTESDLPKLIGGGLNAL